MFVNLQQAGVQSPGMSPILRAESELVVMSEQAATVGVDVLELAQAIKLAVEETAPMKQVHISKYKNITPWNPSGKPQHQRPQLRGEFYQNGQRIHPERLSDNEIKLLNQIKPGRYIGRKVEVIERISNGESAIEIRYSNATPDQRSELKNEFRNLAELCERIIAEFKPAPKQ